MRKIKPLLPVPASAVQRELMTWHSAAHQAGKK